MCSGQWQNKALRWAGGRIRASVKWTFRFISCDKRQVFESVPCPPSLSLSSSSSSHPHTRVFSITPDFSLYFSHFNFMIFSNVGSCSASDCLWPHLAQNSTEVVIFCRRRDWNMPACFQTNVEVFGHWSMNEMGQGRFVTKSWMRKIIGIVFLTPKKPRCCPGTEISWATMFRESISVCSEDPNKGVPYVNCEKRHPV
jgi:hypothetical protein